jgi:nicotinate-nucleotide pyrophosphorylase (carboxylating)
LNHIETLIKLALEEDIDSGDITSNSTIDSGSTSTAQILSKADLVISGIEIAKLVFRTIDRSISFTAHKKDGDRCTRGELIASLEGNTRSLLSGERIALNFLQHLSGIATLTNSFTNAVTGTSIQILDTRKTIPGYRMLEKAAVKDGGGTNHRLGLYDHFLIKNNHITAAGSISKSLELAHKSRKAEQKIEIETRTLDEVREALKGNPDIIMLDNMKPEDVKKAISIISGKAKTEVSGNITLERIDDYKNTEIDYISVGTLTHSAKAADIHMLIS